MSAHRAWVVNCSIMFTGLPLLERPAAAKDAGFDAVSSGGRGPRSRPVGLPGGRVLPGDRGRRLRLTGLNLYAGDMLAGERGVLSHPARVDEFRASLDVTVRIAERTGVRAFNALYGQRLGGVAASEQDRMAAQNLAHAARKVGEFGGTLLIEPLARGLNGAYPLETAAHAVAVVQHARSGGAANVEFLFDTFHLANNGEDLEKTAREYAEFIGHVQIADAPGGPPRHGRHRLRRAVRGPGRDRLPGRTALEYIDEHPDFGWMEDLRG